MPITEKPVSWRFEIETPEIGNDDALTSALWEHDLRSDHVSAAGEDGIQYDGQIFRPASTLRVEAEARWADEELCVSISIRAFFSSPCSRCLEPADIEILNDFMYLYSLRKKPASKRHATEESEDEFRVVPVASWKYSLDISEQVWESVILSLPMRVLCSPECCGICSACGKSLNLGACGCSDEIKDPRFEKLLAIKIDQDTE